MLKFRLRDAFKKKKKNRNMGHCPKRWEGVPTGSDCNATATKSESHLADFFLRFGR